MLPPEDLRSRRKELLHRLDSAIAGAVRPSAGDATRRLRRDASDALDRVAADGADAVLSSDQVSALEAIVIADGSRPIIFVQDDDVALDLTPVSAAWREEIALHREQLRSAIRSVGRIGTLPGAMHHAGTGWVVGDGLVMTNLHVLEAIACRSDSGWVLDGECAIDFVGEANRTARKVFTIRGVRHPFGRTVTGGVDLDIPDLAILEVDTSSQGRRLPDPLHVPAGSLVPTIGHSIYLVGYPGKPSYAGNVAVPAPGSERRDVLETLLGNVYGVKRLSLGKIVENASPARLETLCHDASTLGGNSGAPVVDLEGDAGMAIGLHVGGSPRDRNHAIDLAELHQVVRNALSGT